MRQIVGRACLLLLALACGTSEDGSQPADIGADLAVSDVEETTDAPEIEALPELPAPVDTQPDTPDVPAVGDDFGIQDAEVAEPFPWSPATYAYSACDTTTTAGLAGCVNPAALNASLQAIVGSRFVGEPKWLETRDLCVSTLEGLGFTVEVQRSFLGGNVIGTRQGTGLPSEQVVIGAHFDGRSGCDGANGNGTGVAALLEIARVLSESSHKRTLVVSCWDLGEFQRAGTQEHADDLMVAGADVRVAFVLDALGFTDETPDSQQTELTLLQFPEAKAAMDYNDFRGDTLAFIGGNDAAGPIAALKAAAAAIGLPTLPYQLKMEWLVSPTFQDYRRQGHIAFWDRGFPAVTVTDTGNQRNPQHRCRQGGLDGIDRIDFDFFRAATATALVAIATALDATDSGTTPAPHKPECDLVKQTCGDGKRCVYRRDPDGTEKRTCIAPAADPKPSGGVCTRPTDILGEDDCTQGQFCSFYGGKRIGTDLATPLFERVCSPYCRFTKDCLEGHLCIGIGASTIERTGLCRPTCTIFAEGACPAEQKCEMASITQGFTRALACMPLGPQAAGAVCADTSECGDQLTCVPSQDGTTGACQPLCDTAHACVEPLQCFESFGTILSETELGICGSPQE